jgi:DNA-binding transcriptional regulator YiaG
MSSEFKARIAQLAPIPAEPRETFGSPETIVLRPLDGVRGIQSVFAIKALVRHGVGLKTAKTAIEVVLVSRDVTVEVPMVKDFDAFAAEFAGYRVAARRIGTTIIDVKALRAKLGLTQAEFARTYALDIDTLQNWEQGRCQPDRPALAYLRAIAVAPEVVAKAQEDMTV